MKIKNENVVNKMVDTIEDSVLKNYETVNIVDVNDVEYLKNKKIYNFKIVNDHTDCKIKNENVVTKMVDTIEDNFLKNYETVNIVDDDIEDEKNKKIYIAHPTQINKKLISVMNS